MKKTKMRICLLIVSAMLFTTFMSGCKSTSGTTTSSGSSALKAVTLRWVIPQVQTQNSPTPVFDAANKIIKDKLNATVKFDMVPMANYEAKIKLIIESGEEADIFYTSNWFDNYYTDVTNGGLYDITNLLAKDAPDIKAKFSDAIFNALKIGGKLYAVPNNSVLVRKVGFELRKDLTSKYNFDYSSVKTLADLTPYLATIKKSEPNAIPMCNVNGGTSGGSELYINLQNYFGWNTFVSMQTPGAGYNFGDLKVFDQFETQEFKDFLKTAREWYLAGYTDKDAATMATNPQKTAGKYAVVSDPAAYAGEDTIFSNSQAGGTPYVLDTNVNGDAALQTGSIASNLSSISKSSANPDRALMLLNLVNTDTNLFNLLCWGQENTNYTKNSDGTITDLLSGKYDGIYNFFIGDMMNTWITKGQPSDMYAQMKKLNASGKPSVFLGFTFDSTAVQSQVAQCAAVVQQYLSGLTTGYLDPDKYYPIFIAALKKAGSDQIVAAMQSQVSTWSSKK
jgi:putative aldouronate transport system substrate-binding protein